MNLKFLIISIFTFVSLSNLNAQSKKEQIAILTHKIDSLNSVLNNERSLSLEEITKMNSEIDLISKKLIAANGELINASKDLDKKRGETASLSSENKRLESDLTSLKEEKSRLQLQLDSIVTSNLGIEMIFVEGGTFDMGSNNGDLNQKPLHRVTLSSFYIGKYEITEEEWRAVMGSNGNSCIDCDKCPVVYTDINVAEEFIKKLNSKTGKNYRLPTEAEWEFAAKGGNRSKGYTYSGSNDLSEVGWYSENSGHKIDLSRKSQPIVVGGKKANELGIYDMSGNVDELCSDWYGSYTSETQTNPSGPLLGDHIVFRGGSFRGTKFNCLPTARFPYSSGIIEDDFGFRLVLPAGHSLQPAESTNGREDGYQESSLNPIEEVIKYVGTYQSRGYCSCTTSHGSENVKPKMEMSIWVESGIGKWTNGDQKDKYYMRINSCDDHTCQIVENNEREVYSEIIQLKQEGDLVKMTLRASNCLEYYSYDSEEKQEEKMLSNTFVLTMKIQDKGKVIVSTENAPEVCHHDWGFNNVSLNKKVSKK
jgi:formylglycine-generating enzyme required for sulfatase activity